MLLLLSPGEPFFWPGRSRTCSSGPVLKVGKSSPQAKKPSEDSEDEDMSNSDDEEDEEEGEVGEGGSSRGGPPMLHARQVAPGFGLNRLRACPQRPGLLATWGDSAQVQVRSEGFLARSTPFVIW